MRLRKSIRRSLSILLIGSLTYNGLRIYNDYLEIQIEAKKLEIEDYYIMSIQDVETIEYIKPCSISSAKTYMDYRKITSTTSNQYKYIQENMKVIDGFLYDNEGYIGVALGSWFGEIGSKWEFHLDTGYIINAVKIDRKDDKHTIDGCQHKIDTSVIEFVIDTDTIQYPITDNGYIMNGNFNNIEHFKGEIVKVVKKN